MVSAKLSHTPNCVPCYGIPCYRVVNAKGELAGEFAFGGAWKQGELLKAEGIEVIDGRVDLDKYQLRE